MRNPQNENEQPGQVELLERLVQAQDSKIALLLQQLHRSQQIDELSLQIIGIYQMLHSYHKSFYNQNSQTS